MLTDVKERLSPADVRAKTNGLCALWPASIVSVDTNDVWPRDDWPRDEFFEWFDRALRVSRFKNEYELSRTAGISHSAISGWRKGRQRPSAATLAKVAAALEVEPQEILRRAGAVEAIATMATTADHHQDSWGVQIIERSSALTRDAKDKLIAIFLEQERRDREEKERRLREQINLVSGT